MFTFIKKLLGLDKDTMKAAGVQIEQAPYKVETPPVQDLADIALAQKEVVAANPPWHTAPAEGTDLAKNTLDVNKDGAVNLEDVKEIVKKARKPRTPKAETAPKEKAAKPKKPAAMTAKKPGRKPKAK